jgi:predicted Zn-dependent peptidase
VVIEEIRSVNDSPDELAHELFGRAAFGAGHALGRPLAGTEKTVRGLSAALLRGHRDAVKKSTPVAVVAVGRVEHAEVVARVRRYFKLKSNVRANDHLPVHRRTHAAPRTPITRMPATFRAGHLSKLRDVQQATVVIGGAGCAWSHADRFPLLLLHCALGDGMSSRLFQNLRETHGLVYSIYTNPEFLAREGLFGIGFATDPGQVEKALREAGRELARLRDEGLPAAELKRAKENLKGGMLLGMESTGSRMSALARRLLVNPWEETAERTLARIDAVTRADVLRCARQYLQPKGWASAVVAPKGFKTDVGAALAKL